MWNMYTFHVFYVGQIHTEPLECARDAPRKRTHASRIRITATLEAEIAQMPHERIHARMRPQFVDIRMGHVRGVPESSRMGYAEDAAKRSPQSPGQ